MINELLRRANSTDVPTEVTDAAIATVSATATATATVTDKPVKEKKPRAKQETKSKPVKEAKPVKEKTAKKSNDKKVDEDVQITQPTQTNDDQDDEEVDADLVQIDGKNYYLDAQNVLYDVDTQDPVGRFDKNSNSMTPI